ncbi:MAG: MBL fold metallo-hydrolase [Polyangiaceae bacterium]
MRARSLTVVSGLLLFLTSCGAPPPPAIPPFTPPPPPPPAGPQSGPTAPGAPAATPAALSPADAEMAAKVEIKPEKVAGNVWVLYGAGGNIGVSIGEDGILVVDDQFAPLAPKIMAALRGITDKPIRVVLNTHWHGDHTGGNAFFGRNAAIVAHDNVRKRLVEGRPAVKQGNETLDAVPPAPRDALPIVTFADKVSVHLNGEEIRAIHQPAAHTDGDSVIFFTRSNVVHMGDDFVTYGFPFVDTASGGTVKGIIAAMDKVITEIKPDTKVIPGHGKVSTVEDVRKLSATLKDCMAIVGAEVRKKKSLDQIKAAKPLAKYDDLGKGFIKADDMVEAIYNELTGAKPKAAAPAAAKPLQAVRRQAR